MSDVSQDEKAKGRLLRRCWSILWLLPAWFSPHSRLRTFFHRLRGVQISQNVEIGYFVIIANVDPRSVKILDGATVTARSTILEHDNSMYYARGLAVRSGQTVIGKNAFVGIGSVVMPGVVIGDGAIVGALSLVNRDVAPRSVVGGVPARPLSTLKE